jgi:HPt (histidine-containing phosphotransfer) domain-containing protein
MKADHLNLSEIMDFDLLLHRLEGDVELLRELAALYVAEYPNQLEDLLSAVSCNDLQRVQLAAHKIKGTARSFAAAPAAEAAGDLEETKEFGDGTAISEMAGRLSHELHRLRFALENFLTRFAG